MLMLNNRLTYPESFKQRPEANASITNATANKNWEVTGVNVAVGTVVANGIRATTAGADGDQHIVIPQQDFGQSIVQTLEYASNLRLEWDNVLSLAAGSPLPQFMASGFKLTADFDPTTDPNALIWLYDTSGSANWQLVERVGGTTIATVDSGVVVSAGSMWRLRLRYNRQRQVECWLGTSIDDLRLVHITSALPTSIIDWKPYFGAEQANTAAIIIGYHKADISLDPKIVPDEAPESPLPEDAIFGADNVIEVWDSEQLVVTTGADIDSWTGLKNGYVLLPVGAVQPTIAAGGLNGHSYVNFAYQQDNPLEVNFGVSYPPPFAVLSVFSWRQFSLSAGIWAGLITGTPPNQATFGISAGNVILVAGSVGVNCNGAGWVGPASDFMNICECDGPGLSAICWRNGTVFGSGDPVGAHTLDGTMLARFFGPNRSNELHFYRHVIINGVPSAAEYNSWMTSMGTTYGLAFAPIP